MTDQFYDTIQYLIIDNDFDSVKNIITKIPFNCLQKNSLQTLSKWFIDVCSEHDSKQILRMIINHIDICRISIDKFPFLIELVNILEPSKYQFVMKCYPNKQIIDYLIDIINSQDYDLIKNTINNIDENKIFGSKLDIKDLRYIYDILKTNNDEDCADEIKITQFFKSLISEKLKNPKWIIQNNDNNPLKFIPNNIEIMKVQDATDIILSELRSNNMEFIDTCKFNINIDDLETTIKINYAMANTISKAKMLKHIYNSVLLFDDEILFKYYGPLNNNDSCPDCDKYGGCRMLSCQYFCENVLESDDISEDIFTVDYHLQDNPWFNGKCHKCFVDIFSPRFSLRCPMLDGSWKGCYCSFDCLRSLSEDEYHQLMINNMESQLLETGIYE